MNTIILKRTKACCHALVLGMLLSILPATAWSATATINPSQDNTVAQELPDNSSGACDSIFSGMIDDHSDGRPAGADAVRHRRQIPPGSTINSVTLSMTVTRGDNHVDSTFTLHPNTAAWVEGYEGCGVRGGGQGEPLDGWRHLDHHARFRCGQRQHAGQRHDTGLGQHCRHGQRCPGLARQPRDQLRLGADR